MGGCGPGWTSITAPSTAHWERRRCSAGSTTSTSSDSYRQPPTSSACFFHRLDRVVRRDYTFLLRNRFYEAPPHLAGQRIEARFDPLDPTVVEIYYQGQPEGTARVVDPVVNAQLPSAKPAKAPEPEATGINFVELLKKKKDDEEPPW